MIEYSSHNTIVAITCFCWLGILTKRHTYNKHAIAVGSESQYMPGIQAYRAGPHIVCSNETAKDYLDAPDDCHRIYAFN